MDPEFLYYIPVFGVLLVLSGFFSAAETAYFSLSGSDIQRLKKQKSQPAVKVVQLMANSKRLLITIIIGNTVVNVTTASLAALLALQVSDIFQLDKQLVMLGEVLVVTFVILIFSEIVPKVSAVKNAQRVALRFAFPLTIISHILYPVVKLFELMTQWFQYAFKIEADKNGLSEQELRSLVDFGEEQGTLQKDEKEMIHSIFEFGETTVKEIMIPRIDMVTVAGDAALNDLLAIIKEYAHSRIPVYNDGVDDIIGILYAKDLLPFANRRNNQEFNLSELVRAAYFVPEQKKIDELLREFQTEKIHMAIVVDEYGGTSGLVTLEDIIEEIVGEIQDEYDSEVPLFKKINDHEYLVDGSMSLEEINEEMEFGLPTEEGVETVGGFLYGLFGSVPKEKEIVTWQDMDFTVEKIVHRRIKQVRIRRIQNQTKKQT